MVLGTSWGARSVVLQRRLKIAEWIRRHGVTRVEALSEALGVSVVTIRADLTYLEEQGLVVRSSGKARPVFTADEPRPQETTIRRGAYLPLLRGAASIIGHDLTLLLGPGPLPAQLLPELSDRRGLVLLLTALDAVAMARQCVDGRLHILGGELAPDGSTLGGPQSVHGLAAHRIDLFVMQAGTVAAGCVTLPSGASEPLHQAGCRYASNSIALISDEHPLAMHAGRPGIPLAAVGHLVLPHPPNAAIRIMLAEAGFSSNATGMDDALLFSNNRRGQVLRSA